MKRTCIYLSSFSLIKRLVTLLNLTLEIKFKQQNLSNKAIGITVSFGTQIPSYKRPVGTLLEFYGDLQLFYNE